MGTVYGSSAIAAERLLARYLAADYLFHVKRRSASLIEPMTRATDIAYELGAGSAVNILAEVVTIAALAVVLIVSAPPILLVTVASCSRFVLVPIVLTRRVVGAHRRSRARRSISSSCTCCSRASAPSRTSRSPAGSRSSRSAFATSSASSASPSSAARGRPAVARLGVETTLILCMLIVVFLVMRSDVSGGDTVSVLALFAYTGFRVVPSANRIMLNVGYMREAHPWIRGMDEDMRRLRVPAPRPFEHAPPMLQATLACEDVSFRYEDAPRPALDHVTFTIARGQSIGIVGPTGAGKSTLVDVLLGLLTPTSGRVLVDGQPLEGRERAWQRQIGYVSQDVYLLDDSLRRNIAFGIPDGAIDETRLAHAVSQARLDEVVGGAAAEARDGDR